MSVYELTQILSAYNLKLIVIAFISFLLTFLVKKCLPDSLKRAVALVPFILCILMAFGCNIVILKDYQMLETVKEGFKAGGIATLYYAVFKQFKVQNGTKKALEYLLKGIVESKSVKAVTDKILNASSGIKNYDEQVKSIKELISTVASLTENECNAITGIIIKTINGGK